MSITQSSKSFAGVAAIGYISNAIFGAKTLKNEWVKIHTNVNWKKVLRTLDLGNNLIQDYNPYFTGATAPTKSEVILEVERKMSTLEWPTTDLENDWEGPSYKGTAGNPVMPQEFFDATVKLLEDAVAKENELMLYRGNYTGNSAIYSAYTKYTGLLRRIDLGSPMRVSASAVTKSNVTACLEACYNKMLTEKPDVMGNLSDVKFYVDPTLFGYLSQAQNLTDSRYLVDEGVPKFLGIELRVTEGMPKDRIIFCNPERLNFGTWLTTDFNNVRVANLENTTLDLITRARMDYMVGTKVDLTDEVVFFS